RSEVSGRSGIGAISECLVIPLFHCSKLFGDFICNQHMCSRTRHSCLLSIKRFRVYTVRAIRPSTHPFVRTTAASRPPLNSNAHGFVNDPERSRYLPLPLPSGRISLVFPPESLWASCELHKQK